MKDLCYERYGYLFLDMEWNQKEGTTELENREPIQIAIIETDEELECKKTFSRGICLKDGDTLTEKTCKLVGVSKKSVMQGKTEEEILEKVSLLFPEYKYIVVWTRDTYELFKAGMERAEIRMPKHKVIVLQDIVNLIAMDEGKNIGFESALIKGGIAYDFQKLHCSKHDVRYLYELFKKLYFKYIDLTKEEIIMINFKTKILHSIDCKYAQGKTLEKEINMKSLLFFGYRPCLHCGTEKEWRRMQWQLKKKNKGTVEDMRELPLTEENILRICSRFSMECNIAQGVLCLKTAVGYWHIYLQGDKVKKIFHGNYKIKKDCTMFKRGKKFMEDYHKQDISMDNFFDVIKYIYYHDKYLYKKM